MSAEIESISGQAVAIDFDGDDIGITFVSDDKVKYLNPADFLAAVASELDVIVIPRADLPEVKSVGRDGLDYRVTFADGSSQTFSDETAESVDATVLGWVAIREHLRNVPPVDEEEVAVLVHTIGSEVGTIKMGELDRIARRLVAAGWKR